MPAVVHDHVERARIRLRDNLPHPPDALRVRLVHRVGADPLLREQRGGVDVRADDLRLVEPRAPAAKRRADAVGVAAHGAGELALGADADLEHPLRRRPQGREQTVVEQRVVVARHRLIGGGFRHGAAQRRGRQDRKVAQELPQKVSEAGFAAPEEAVDHDTI